MSDPEKKTSGVSAAAANAGTAGPSYTDVSAPPYSKESPEEDLSRLASHAEESTYLSGQALIFAFAGMMASTFTIKVTQRPDHN